MAQRDDIIQELNDPESRLATVPARNVYQVPAGYFDNLAAQVMDRIRAMEVTAVHQELAILSPLLSGLEQVNPYTMPDGYFDRIEKTIPGILAEDDSAEEELSHLSPLLGGLKKQMPYSVPAGYFDQLESTAVQTAATTGAKVITMQPRNHSWLRYAAAAVITALVALGSFYYFNGRTDTDPSGTSYGWVKEQMNDVSTDALDEFVTTAEKETALASTIETSEIRELMKNISDKELQDFVNDTEAIAADTDEDILLN